MWDNAILYIMYIYLQLCITFLRWYLPVGLMFKTYLWLDNNYENVRWCGSLSNPVFFWLIWKFILKSNKIYLWKTVLFYFIFIFSRRGRGQCFFIFIFFIYKFNLLSLTHVGTYLGTKLRSRPLIVCWIFLYSKAC